MVGGWGGVGWGGVGWGGVVVVVVVVVFNVCLGAFQLFRATLQRTQV